MLGEVGDDIPGAPNDTEIRELSGALCLTAGVAACSSDEAKFAVLRALNE